MALEKTIQLVLKAKDEASSVLKGVGTKMKDFGIAAGKALIGLGVAAAAATAAVAAVVQKTLDFGDNLGKTADQLGITTEALAGLRLAGDLAGISAGELDKSVRTLQRNIAEAADGTAAQADAFENLGLSIKEVQKLSPEEQFIQVVGALNQVEDQTVKTQVALDLFGRAGAKALNLTEEGMRAALKESEDFGLSISRLDAKNMEDVNDATTRVKTAFQGAGTQLTLALLEPLKGLALRLVELAKNGTLAEWGRRVGDVAGDIISFITDTILATGKLDAAFKLVSSGFTVFTSTVKVAAAGIALALTQAIAAPLNILNTLTFGKIGFLDDITTGINDFRTGAVISMKEAMSDLSSSTSDGIDAFKTLDSQSSTTQQAVKELADSVGDSAETTDRAATATDKLKESEKSLAEETKKSTEELKKQKNEAEKTALEFEKIASNERIRTIELAVGFNTKKLESDVKKFEKTFDSIDATIESTGSLIDSLFGRQGQASASGFTINRQIEGLLKSEVAARKVALDDQHLLATAQIENTELQNQRLREGGGLITITADGLEPELEAFMFKIIERVQIRVDESASEFLLATTGG